MGRLAACLVLVIGCVTASACAKNPVALHTTMIGGTSSLFLGERGFGEYNRDAEATTGERIRDALRTRHRLGVDILNRMAMELAMLRTADPLADLASAVAKVPGPAGRFLQAGARRYAFVVHQAAYVASRPGAAPIADTCGYTGPEVPGDGEVYDPRELCWWRETLRQAGVLNGENTVLAGR